tara:strand:- start:13630 stop:13824 length:195 start_codon:yes stop_codon:yes gene_type:complete
MKNNEIILFAVYKNGIHLGNEKGKNSNDVIRNYLKAALYGEFLDDEDFVSLYSVKRAIKSIHYL